MGQGISATTGARFLGALTLAGRFFVTTESVPATVFAPILTPGSMLAPPPIQMFSPRVMGLTASNFSLRSYGSRGQVLEAGRWVRSWHPRRCLLALHQVP